MTMPRTLSLSLGRASRRPEGRGMTSLIQVCNQAAEVERLLGLGARRVDWRYPEQADYVVLADPDGNTFCVVQK